MTTACTLTTPAMGTRSLLFTWPETGRGQASLWTAAAAPDHRLWTTLRGPVDPSRLPTCPLPRRRRRASRYLSITTTQKERRPTDLFQVPVAEPALVNIDSPQTGGPFPSIKVGHTGLSKARCRLRVADVVIDQARPRRCAGDGIGRLLERRQVRPDALHLGSEDRGHAR
jgi:hypothetical protein